MNKLRIFIILFALSVFRYGFEGKSITTKNESETNSEISPTSFTEADLTGANLGEVSLDGVILCNTTIPDATINNTSCEN
jgi:uncharacterized protein YjbI with pentapeptide repeats